MDTSIHQCNYLNTNDNVLVSGIIKFLKKTNYRTEADMKCWFQSLKYFINTVYKIYYKYMRAITPCVLKITSNIRFNTI